MKIEVSIVVDSKLAKATRNVFMFLFVSVPNFFKRMLGRPQNVRFIKNWAVQLGSTLYFTQVKKENIRAAHLNHESIHVCQWYTYGAWGFLWRYAFFMVANIFMLKNPYYDHPFEKEAYDNMYDPDYIEKVYPQYELSYK